MKTSFQFGPEDSNLTADQKAWLRNAYRVVIRLLKKNGTFHAPDFWDANTKGDYPRSGNFWNYEDNRTFGRVIRQVITHGHMTDSNPGWGKRVGKTATFKPVYTATGSYVTTV